MKRLLALALLPILMAPCVRAQSLADLARKEKERRAALKGKAATVVTNKSLAGLKKKPAMVLTSPSSEVAAAGAEAANPPAAGGEADAESPAASPAGTEPETSPVVSVDKSPPTPREMGGDVKAGLEDNLKKADEMVELLTLKMSALWQQFYGTDQTPRDEIQRQISETYEKLLKAQDVSARARKDLEDWIAKNRGPQPSIWVR